MTEGYKLKVNWNVAAINLIDIQTITASGDNQPFAGPKALPLFDPGVEKIRTDGTVFYTTFPEVTWRFGFLTYNQWLYLQNTYCGGSGGFSGKVTILTDQGDAVFVRRNAILILPKPASLQGFPWYQKVDIKMTRLAVPS